MHDSLQQENGGFVPRAAAPGHGLATGIFGVRI
jgi:hypothetical protein